VHVADLGDVGLAWVRVSLDHLESGAEGEAEAAAIGEAIWVGEFEAKVVEGDSDFFVEDFVALGGWVSE